jgi:TonB family protein
MTMKIALVISALFLLMLNSINSQCNGQTNDLQKPNNAGITDTIFFEIDSTFKNLLIHFEEMPEFPGGEKAMTKYLSEKTIYPESAIIDSISGLVRLRFLIDSDGSTKNCKIYTSLRKDIDNECIRVVEEMPKWKPASTVFSAKKGLYRKNVPTSYILIFNFVLNDTGDKIGIIVKPK